jgi:hypothetical protein
MACEEQAFFLMNPSAKAGRQLRAYVQWKNFNATVCVLKARNNKSRSRESISNEKN